MANWFLTRAKEQSLINSAGTTRFYMQKNEIEPLTHTIYKN